MCWVDRLALVWAGFVAFFYFVMCYGPAGLDPVFSRYVLLLVFWMAVPPWLFLRGLRWTFHRGA